MSVASVVWRRFAGRGALGAAASRFGADAAGASICAV
jgi:hypothetical protein